MQQHQMSMALCITTMTPKSNLQIQNKFFEIQVVIKILIMHFLLARKRDCVCGAKR